ncbi:four helix bundle protein [Flavobacteriaceae bacterium 14752]|uniref:four helix bundle protein n=1 Tax=Mesohalobacter salilacus TaxID=2491711 RepID=UPI000F6306B5|nr:four helix bundle protein [Flavobacteriaceae bacterium 14752]
MKTNNLIQDKTFQFALDVIKFYMQLVGEKEYVLSKQLLKSGTSIGSNVEEAIAAQSRKDFISKMSIESKESRETRYWLRLLSKSNLTSLSTSVLLKEINDIINIITKIILTTKSKN